MENNTAQKHLVGVSDMKVSANEGDIIVTHSLGSCIGVTIYDPKANVGGMLHYQLPSSDCRPERAAENPCMFADTGLPALFKSAYRLGAEKKRLVVKVAGGSNVMDKTGFFQIGRRNYISLKKILWKNGVLIAAEDIGGDSWRTMKLEIGTGRVLIKNGSGEFEL
ncbi:MAG TPA: chemotaxis protein CheD [bacterium]|nr:chemotaxis protein CheD [bacterium]HPI78813.1 chemotaxis protein CheD [bacterium]